MNTYIISFTGGDISCSGDISILAALRENGIRKPDAPCGGTGRCGKCTVAASGRVRDIATGEIADVREKALSACRYAPAGDVYIEFPGELTAEIVSSDGESIPGGGIGLGFAADIGTTTVVARLYDLASGELLAERRAANPQSFCGADVMSRLEYCRRGGLKELTAVTKSTLEEMLSDMCASAGRERAELMRATIAGNTTMQHIIAGLTPDKIAVPPFEPDELFGKELDGVINGCAVYMMPCVSGYVGGDTAAGLAALDASEGITLYVDIGTNGEIALGSADSFAVCAAAAGPAFEGAEISCGMEAAAGAIDCVEAAERDIRVHTIGEAKPIGICGSGLISACAALLKLGVIQRRGSFTKEEKLPEKLRERMAEINGDKAFMLADGVYLTARDIRQYQLAKAAIRAGIASLLERTGTDVSEISRLIIAGGFGSRVDIVSAAATGLLPEVSCAVIQAGNSSLRGASLALGDELRIRAERIARSAKYIDLTTDRTFGERFLKELIF